MSANAFTPRGNSAVLSVTSTSTETPIQVKGTNNASTQREFYNAGPNDCWYAWGNDGTVVAVAPTAGSPANGIPIPAGAVIIHSLPPNAYIAAITLSTQTASLYITPGEGT